MTSDHTPDQYVERLCLNPYCPLDSDHTGACPQPDTAPEGPWTVTVVIDVDESVAQGDEADLAHERIIEAFQSTPPTGGWGLDGVSIQVGPLNGAPATSAERAIIDAAVAETEHEQAHGDCPGGTDWEDRATTAEDRLEGMYSIVAKWSDRGMVAPKTVALTPQEDAAMVAFFDWRRENDRPTEPVCTTCLIPEGHAVIESMSYLWRRNVDRAEVQAMATALCPDCRPVGDLPGDTGNQP